MSSAGMAALRQDAHSLLDRVPEDKLATVVQFMRDVSDDSARKKELQARRAAFERLEEIIHSFPPVTDLDEEKELAEWREEKFGNGVAD